MARRIPKSRKHKKLKSVDPDCKRDIGKRLSNAFNFPPNEDQEIPRKLKELMRLKNLVKENKFKKKRKKKLKQDYITVKCDLENQEGMMKNSVNNIPKKLKQRKNETEERFIWRITQLTNEKLEEANIAEKFCGDMLDRKITENTNKKIKNKQLKRKLAIEKRKEKKLMKIENKKDDFAEFIDEIKFGEVVKEPPKLTFLKKYKKLKAGQDFMV